MPASPQRARSMVRHVPVLLAFVVGGLSVYFFMASRTSTPLPPEVPSLSADADFGETEVDASEPQDSGAIVIEPDPLPEDAGVYDSGIKKRPKPFPRPPSKREPGGKRPGTITMPTDPF